MFLIDESHFCDRSDKALHWSFGLVYCLVIEWWYYDKLGYEKANTYGSRVAKFFLVFIPNATCFPQCLSMYQKRRARSSAGVVKNPSCWQPSLWYWKVCMFTIILVGMILVTQTMHHLANPTAFIGNFFINALVVGGGSEFLTATLYFCYSYEAKGTPAGVELQAGRSSKV